MLMGIENDTEYVKSWQKHFFIPHICYKFFVCRFYCVHLEFRLKSSYKDKISPYYSRFAQCLDDNLVIPLFWFVFSRLQAHATDGALDLHGNKLHWAICTVYMT